MKSQNYLANENNNQFILTNRSKFSRLLIIAFLSVCALTMVSETHAATITVDRTDDTAAAAAAVCSAAANDCSLRGAFAFANANSGTVINLPAGTYNLSLDELRVGTSTNVSTTITGAGAATTTINQTVANRRVINLNPSLAANVVVNISGVRISGGNSPSDNFGGGGLIGGGAGNTLNLTNCVFENNSDVNAQTAKGGAVEWAGGGFLNINNCTFNNNTAGSAASNVGTGGGVDYQLLNLPGTAGQGGLTITNSTFTNNKAGASNSGAGGGLAIVVTTTQTPRTVTVTNNTFTNNQANAASNGRGGAITSSSSNPLTIKYNRIAGNTATGNVGTGIYQATGTVGTIDATENWWGCNLGPNNPGCDSVGGVIANITYNPRIVLTHTVNPNPITLGQSTIVTASFLRDSAGNALTLANISRLIGLPITFVPTRGTISNAQTVIQPDGTATATFTSNAAGAGSVATVVDNSTDAIASITINKADTALTIVSDSPDPTVTGQSYTVTFTAPTVSAFGIGAPTGTVTVSDGTNSCTATLPATSCNLTSLTVGEKTLTATYNGDSNYNASTSSNTIPHTVTKANTSVAIVSAAPEPSVFGQNYAVSVNVTVNAPGNGTPGSGTITVSDGTNSCTITLPATSCNLPGDAVGTKTLTAIYNGDANYFASAPSAPFSHTIIRANTTTTITAASPNPSNTNQNVVVSFTVTANAPGAGTPTGTVTVSDGTNSCTGTVAEGQCTITFSSGGSYSLTATYSGDTNFASSVSAIFTQKVCNGLSVTVSNANDSGAGSLRQAILDVCAGGTITFDASFNSPQTIILTSGEIVLSRDITLSGTGANLLTISGNNLSRVFLITGGAVNLSGMTITGGLATGDGNGGGISITGGTVTLTNTVVSGNVAPNFGGGIYSAGSLTIVGSTVSNNTANSPTGRTGGGIHSLGTMTMTNSTVSGNSVTNGINSGGGIRVEGATTINSSTITNNSAVGSSSTSGIRVSLAGTVTMRNSIVAANQNNTTFPDVAGGYTSASAFNLIGVGTGIDLTNGTNGNQTGTSAAPLDPRLAPLANNGGTTPTHALLSGSPAIDKGNSFGLTTDQRGFARPIDNTAIPNATNGDGSDIGAFEAQLAPTAANVSVSGRILVGGRGLRNAVVFMIDANGNTRAARTSLFGYFRFENVEAGQSYVFQVNAKRFSFDPQVITINETLTELIFTAQPVYSYDKNSGKH